MFGWREMDILLSLSPTCGAMIQRYDSAQLRYFCCRATAALANGSVGDSSSVW